MSETLTIRFAGTYPYRTFTIREIYRDGVFNYGRDTVPIGVKPRWLQAPQERGWPILCNRKARLHG